jgi:P27 family predicted phage terminase small subunit
MPKPTALKVLAGETRPSVINYAEPIPEGGSLTPPKDLRLEARVIWEQVVAALGRTGVLTSADKHILRLYAEAMARYLEAETMLSRTGPLIKGRDGNLVKNPLHQIVRDNADAVKKYAREMGLTPAARVGLRGEIDDSANSATAKLDAIIRAARRS